MKTCRICKIEKELDRFYKDSTRKDGYDTKCSECAKELQANRPLELKRKAWRKADNKRKGKRHEYHLSRTYGLTEEDYEKMLHSQGYACKICKTEEPNGKHKRFVVDHCHVTGKVRGLLCDRCNQGIGKLYDNPDIVYKAYKYLKDFG